MPNPTAVERARAAIAALDDAQLDAAVLALGDGEHLATLAQALNVKRPALASHPTPSEIVRARLANGAPGRAAYAALALAGPCADDCIAALGDAADDPTREHVDAVLADLVERHGAPMVTLMLAAYPAIAAPCTAVFEGVLDDDERFAIPEAAVRAAAEQRRAAASTDVVVDEAEVERARKDRDARIAAEAARRRKTKKKR